MSGSNFESAAISDIVDLTRETTLPNTDEPIHYIVLPNNCTLESLADLQYPHGVPPDRIKADVKLSDAASFISYTEAYADDRTRIFASFSNKSFVAVIDYHGTGERKPEFLSHRAHLQLRFDDRWATWSQFDQHVMKQDEFAEFIEDNLKDIVTPEPAFMLEVARDLTAKIDVNFGSSTRLSNGQVKLQYQEEMKAGVGAGNLEVPETFAIRLPVFEGGSAATVTARLRFRIVSGKLTFFYKLDRPARVIRDAFDAEVVAVKEALKTAVLFGNP